MQTVDIYITITTSVIMWSMKPAYNIGLLPY